MKPSSFAGLFALLPVTAALAGCTPRAVPASFPASSAASPQAAEAPAPRVGIALAEDPPLPGESTEGWYGLEPKGGQGAQPHHHHHHGPAPAGDPGAGHAH